MQRSGQVGPPYWDDRPVFLVGGGASLAGRDLSRLRERGYVIGINRAADMVPVDATFSLDLTFIDKYRHTLAVWATDHEVFLAVPEDYAEAPIPGVVYLKRVQGKGVSWNPSEIVNGLNSGYGAVNLAVLKRAREIYLLGYDLNTSTHWHGGYPWNNGSSLKYYDRWAVRFGEIARALEGRGIDVWNYNPDSGIRCFPFKELDI